MEQAAQFVVLEVPETQTDTAQMLEASVDRLDRTVRCAATLEECQHLSPFAPKRPTQLSTSSPFRAWNENAAWLEVVLMATDPVAWTKRIAFADDPVLAECKIVALRYRVFTLPPPSPAALDKCVCITRGARQVRLRVDKTSRWAAAIAAGWGRIRTAFG